MANYPTVRTYQQARALMDLRNKQGRTYAKLGNNLYLERRAADALAVRYHQTDIVTFRPDGKIELRCGGWYTMTTKQNIGAFSPFTVYQEKKIWYVNVGPDFTDANIVPFEDGMILDTPEWAALIEHAYIEGATPCS